MSSLKVVAFANQVSEVAVVLDRINSLARAEDIDPVVVCVDAEVKTIADQHAVARTIQLRESSVDNLQKQAVLWADTWASTGLGIGRSPKAELLYEGMSLWWLCLPVLYPDIQRCMKYVNAFTDVLKTEKADIAVYVDKLRRPMLPFRLNRAYDLPSRLCALTASSGDWRLEAVRPALLDTAAFSLSWCGRRVAELLFRWPGSTAVRWLRLMVWRLSKPAAGKIESGLRRMFVFSTISYWRPTASLCAVDSSEDDVFASPVMRVLHDRNDWRLVDIDTEVNLPSWTRIRKLFSKVRKSFAESRPVESTFTRHVRRQAGRGVARMADVWQRWRNDSSFRRSLTYRGVNLWPLLEVRFQFLFETYLAEALRIFHGVESLLRRESPDAVLIEYEEGSYGRAATAIAQRMGIPTVALQHGIHGGAYIPSYFFREVLWEGEGDVTACPIPTRTAVFGEHTREMLTGVSAYPNEAVVVTGSPQYDVLLGARDLLPKDAAKRSLGLEEGPLVVVTSSIFTEIDDRQWFVDNVLQAVRKASHLNWAVKLHPHESAAMWEKTAARQRNSLPILFRDRLWPLLAAADFVVSWYSTTILEAMLLEKPVVVLQMTGRNNAGGFIDAGAVETASDGARLAEILQSLSSDATQRAGVVGRSRETIARHLHSLDGRAANRVADTILGLMEPDQTERCNSETRESLERAR